jgi:Transposase DDE domain
MCTAARKANHCAGTGGTTQRKLICTGQTLRPATPAPVKAACTTGDQGRTVSRSFDAAYLDRVRAYHATPAYHKAMRKRAVWVEPLFGEAKDWHGLRRFRLRGLTKVNIEALVIAAGQNLKHWLSMSGPARRSPPGGSCACDTSHWPR